MSTRIIIPKYEDLSAVANGGDNIKYGAPAKPLPE